MTVSRKGISGRAVLLTAFVAAQLGFPAVLAAQGPGMISGTIRDSAGAGVSGAEISAATGEQARSDELGSYRLSLALGAATLTVRRLGFIPVTIAAVPGPPGAPATVDLVLSAVPSVLPPVVVRANKVKYRGRLAGYYERLERRAGGSFIAREHIDQVNARSLSELLTNVPGVNAVRTRGGGGAVRLRGRTCWPLVWLDGMPMGAGEVDLDAFPPHTIHGIEIYSGATTAPMRYTGARNMSSCGTILLWSRGPDTDPVTRPIRPRLDLERMIASLSVYTADQVDTPAELDGRRKLDVVYPAALVAEGGGGSVIAEFVVDRRGQVEEATIGIVSSTDPELSDAVRSAVGRATFRPALIDGKPVRQIVQQPFSFAPRPVRDRRS